MTKEITYEELRQAWRDSLKGKKKRFPDLIWHQAEKHLLPGEPVSGFGLLSEICPPGHPFLGSPFYTSLLTPGVHCFHFPMVWIDEKTIGVRTVWIGEDDNLYYFDDTVEANEEYSEFAEILNKDGVSEHDIGGWLVG